MKMRASILAIGAIGLALLGFSLHERPPRMLYNPSPSAPIGWYKIVAKGSYDRGDLVAAWLPKHAEELASKRGYLPKNIPVIKRIGAVPGDTYCIEADVIRLSDGTSYQILSTDSQGRELPGLLDGCRSISAGKFLILSDRVSNSFDSRYFGEVDVQAVLGMAEYVGDFGSLIAPVSREEGGARGQGAQGKIKEVGANPPLKPCLHIDFYGVKVDILELSLTQIARDCWDSGSVTSRSFSQDHPD